MKNIVLKKEEFDQIIYNVVGQIAYKYNIVVDGTVVDELLELIHKNIENSEPNKLLILKKG